MAASRTLGLLALLTLGLLLTAGGFCLGHFLGKPLLDHARSSTHWPSVVGKIESSNITSHRDRKGKHTYGQEVEYSYTVAGQALKNHVVWFGDDYTSNSRSSHQAVVTRYPPGKEVQVHYDPERPEMSVLEPGAKFSSYGVYAIGWVLTIIGIIMVLGGAKGLLSPI